MVLEFAISECAKMCAQNAATSFSIFFLQKAKIFIDKYLLSRVNTRALKKFCRVIVICVTEAMVRLVR